MTSDDARALYQTLVMDHARNPRNLRTIEHPDREQHGRNPLCGDHCTLFLSLTEDTITDISFQAEGCAISIASASMLTEHIKGKQIPEAQHAFTCFCQLVQPTDPNTPPDEDLGPLRAFATLREHPARAKCATLAWFTLQAALEERTETVTTE